MMNAVKLLCGLLALLVSGATLAQSAYPQKPVRLIVPVPAGGLQDAFARALSAEMSRSWGQNLLVDNRPGATGIIAGELAARSAPDGYTVFMTDNVTVMTNHLTRRDLPFDFFKNFTPVIGLIAAGNVLVVNQTSTLRSVQDILAQARSRPGELTYGSFGIGSSPHVDTEALSVLTGVKMTHVPYKGGPAILQGLMGGQISFSLTGLPPALPLIRQGKLRALAYGGSQRSAAMPDVPTFSEAGVSDFESTAWFGWFVPASTPQAIIDRIASEAAKVITQPEFRGKFIEGVGLELLNLPPAPFASKVKGDFDKFAARLKSINFKLE